MNNSLCIFTRGCAVRGNIASGVRSHGEIYQDLTLKQRYFLYLLDYSTSLSVFPVKVI